MERRQSESASFDVLLPCCTVCASFLDLYESKMHWAVQFIRWYMPLILPFYMYVSHYHFSFSRMRLSEAIGVPILMMMLLIVMHAGIWVLNQFTDFEFRMTYNAIRPLIADKPTGMIGNLGPNNGKRSILPGRVMRLGDFGSGQYSIQFCQDVHIRLPVQGKRKERLIEHGERLAALFEFDRASGKLQLIPYFFGVYLFPISALLLFSLLCWSDYVDLRAGLQTEGDTLAFEERVLQQRQDGQPMTAAACEAELGRPDLCRSRGCVPVAEGLPDSSFERVSVGSDELFCPSVSKLEKNVRDADASLRRSERYRPPISELVPALLSMMAAGLMSLLLLREAFQHLRPAKPRAGHDDDTTGPSPVLLVGGCVLALAVLGGVGSALTGVAYLGYSYVTAEPEWEVPRIDGNDATPAQEEDYRTVEASMARLESWLSAGCPASPQTHMLVRVSLSEAIDGTSQIVAARVLSGGTEDEQHCVITHMESGVSVSRTQTMAVQTTQWFSWP